MRLNDQKEESNGVEGGGSPLALILYLSMPSLLSTDPSSNNQLPIVRTT